jgi:hypothetical protein
MPEGLLKPQSLLSAPSARALRRRGAPAGGARRAPPPRRARAMNVRADLWSSADTLLTAGAVAVAAGAALLAVFADPAPPARLKEQQENGFRWGIMGAISCLPLFNWMVSARGRVGGGCGEQGTQRSWWRWRREQRGAAGRAAAVPRMQGEAPGRPHGWRALRGATPTPPPPPPGAPPQGWVFAALEDQERARTYYWFAALYALPLLHSGLEFDRFSLAMLLTGAAHMQVRQATAARGPGARTTGRAARSALWQRGPPPPHAPRSRLALPAPRPPTPSPAPPLTPTPKPAQAERIAATEPDLQAKIAGALRPLSIVRTVARAARALLSALLPAPRPQLPGGGGRAWAERVGPDGIQKTKSDELAEALTRQELEDFDRRMRERELSQRRGGGGGRSGPGGGAPGGSSGW